MFCSSCGTQAPEGSGFCQNCGANMADNKSAQPGNQQTAGNSSTTNSGDQYAIVRNPVTCILLTIVTCGIYAFYWDWITKDQINRLANKEIISTGLLILSWLCFPVMFYVWYKWDLAMQDITQQYNVRYNSNFILWIVLTFVAGVGNFVMIFQLQETLNSVYGGE